MRRGASFQGPVTLNAFRRGAHATRPCAFSVRCVHIDHANVPDAVGPRPSASLQDTICSRNRVPNGVLLRSFRHAELAQRAGCWSELIAAADTTHTVDACGCNALRRFLTGALQRAALPADRTFVAHIRLEPASRRCSADRRAARPQAVPPGLGPLRERRGATLMPRASLTIFAQADASYSR